VASGGVVRDRDSERGGREARAVAVIVVSCRRDQCVVGEEW